MLRILGTLDGTLTTTAQQVLVKQMWQGGKTDFFTSTLGEMYLMRHAARLDLPSSAASALGRPAPHGYLYLAQVKDRLVQDRTYDLVVIARRSSDTPALTRTDLDPDIVIRADMKWYLKMTSSLDTDALVDQFAKDLIQSIERHWAAGGPARCFHDLLYGVPASSPHLVDQARTVIPQTFRDLAARDLSEIYGMPDPDIDAIGDALDERLDLGNMVVLVPDSAD